MYDIVKNLEINLLKKPALKSKESKELNKIYLSPSRSMCYTYDNEPLGTCLKQAWLDHKNKPVSNPIDSYGVFVAESGNIWEDWLIRKYTEMGIFLDHNIKLVDNEYSISGEIDILHINPETGQREVTECKTWSGSNYYAAKDLLGKGNILPKPKDSHLLQVAKYLLALEKYDIKIVNILYLDRTCSSFYNNKQFEVYLNGKDIHYNVIYKGVLHSYKEERFNIDSLLVKDSALIKLIELDYVPDPDYKISYTLQDIEEKFKAGLMGKTNYNKVLRGEINPEDMSDWQCRYCKYGKNRETGKSTCLEVQNV